MIGDTNGFSCIVVVLKDLDGFRKYIDKLHVHVQNPKIAYSPLIFRKAYLYKLNASQYAVFLDYSIQIPVLWFARFKWLVKWALKRSLRKNGVIIRFERFQENRLLSYLLSKQEARVDGTE